MLGLYNADYDIPADSPDELLFHCQVFTLAKYLLCNLIGELTSDKITLFLEHMPLINGQDFLSVMKSIWPSLEEDQAVDDAIVAAFFRVCRLTKKELAHSHNFTMWLKEQPNVCFFQCFLADKPYKQEAPGKKRKAANT